jgi:hypothetical protein
MMETKESFIEDRFAVSFGGDGHLEAAIARTKRYVRLEIVKGEQCLPIVLDCENHELKAHLQELRWLIDMIEDRAKENAHFSGEL